MTDNQTLAAKPRGRPGRKAETPQQRLERLERETAAARRAVADAEQAKLAAIGAAVLSEAEHDPAFMYSLRDILRERVKGKAAKAAVASLLDAPLPGDEKAAS